jgi:hypothetical protein
LYVPTYNTSVKRIKEPWQDTKQRVDWFKLVTS